MRRTCLVVISFMIMSLLAACGDGKGTAAGSSTVRVGLAVSLSGANSDTGQKLRDGAELWVKQGHKIDGKPVELVVRDDESDPATSARLYERLISTDKVDLLIGPYGSGPGAAVAKVADRHHKFILQTGASAQTIFTSSKMSVQLMSPQLHLPALALRLAKEKGYKTVAAATVDNPYGTEVLEGVKLYTDKLGMKLVHEEKYAEDARDLSSMILKMKDENPDVVYVGAYVPDGILFMRQAKQLGLNPKMYVLGATGPVTPQFPKSLGATADYVMGTAQWFPGAPYPGAQEFVEAWNKEHPGVTVDYVQATGYGAMEVLSKVVKDAGSFDDDALLKTALAANYNTMYGGFKLDKDGVQIAERGVVTQIQDGKIVAIYPKGPTTKTPLLPTPHWDQR